MTAYYNEIDPFAAAWLRELIKAGHIAPGEVDERSIEDIHPDDLRPFRQCHFFAGIGVWSYALRRIGWPDDARIWTGSCPCQPFSAAGKGGGFVDERHLWPHFHYLVTQCGPPIVVGEQVASKDGLAWLDLVQADMEGTGYAFGAVDTCAAGVGAPHIRQRLYWIGKGLADATSRERPRLQQEPVGGSATGGAGVPDRGCGHTGGLADADGPRSFPSSLSRVHRSEESAGSWDVKSQRPLSVGGLGHDDHTRLEGQRGGYQAEGGRVGEVRPAAPAGEFGGLAHSHGRECDRLTDGKEREFYGTPVGWDESHGVNQSSGTDLEFRGSTGRVENGSGAAVVDRICDVATWPGPVNGFWGDADWLYCRDGKWRPAQSSTFPLAHGAAARVGRLRGYGNAINAEQAAHFLQAALMT